MKILSPSQTRDIKGQEMARDIMRGQELKEIINDLNKKRANAEADFQKTLAQNLAAWAKEEEDHAARRRLLEREIDDLEAKKLNALIPVSIIKDGANNQMEDAVAYLAKLRLREENLDDLTEKLEDKLDAVGEREQTVKQEERKIVLLKQGIDRQKDLTIDATKKLSDDLALFASEKAQTEESLEKKKTELFLLERSLLAKEQKLKRDEKALRDLDTRLHDERETLDRAWKELKRISP